MPITLSKIKYGTRSIVHFEALEQTLRLRLVSGPADKKFFLIIGTAPNPTVPALACSYVSWWVWEILDKHPALVRYYSEGVGAAAAFLCHYYLLRT